MNPTTIESWTSRHNVFLAGAILLCLAFALLFCGCAPFHFSSNTPDTTQASSGIFHLFSGNGQTATEKAKLPGQSVAKAVSSIVHGCEWAGLLCLIAAGALGYFGNIIPAVKVGLAGLALIVFARWFDYHYGMVIAALLIAAAVGFMWAWYKDDPSEVKALLGKVETLASGAGKSIETAGAGAVATVEKKI